MGAAVAKLFAVLALLICLTGNAFAEKTSCAVPLRMVWGMPFAQVMVNGRGPFTFLVDTGTSTEVIVTPGLARKLRLPVVGRSYLADLSELRHEVVNAVGLDSITVGGETFFPRSALVHGALATAGSYDGILGFAFFRDRLLTMDYPHRCMTVTSGSALHAEDDNVLPLKMQRNGPMVMVGFRGTTVPVVVDTGGSGLNLPAQGLGRFEFAPDTAVAVQEDTQLGRTFLRGGEVGGRIVLGAHEFRNPFVTITRDVPFGSLGAAVLKDFVITFDQARGLVRFESKKRRHTVEWSQLLPWNPARAHRGGWSLAESGD